jgi:carbon storage regulator
VLVLQRKEREIIRIGDNIKIMLVQVRDKSRAKIGIIAPLDMPVHREEIYQKIRDREVTNGEEKA